MATDDASETDGDGSEESRQQGVELGALDDELAAHDYPATADALVAEYGDYEIDLPGGSQRLDEVLGLLEGDDPEYADAEAARQAIYALVGSEAVGRDDYSDRGGSAPEEGDDGDDESF
ncbi:hypothetical protein ABSL23_12270 [Halobacterium sp. NMX12-1]|uniref:DUF2795 domain-containing protein n=1 Tax=Halobacterium sp. NMX12-1 TaxID=3166650 RepID=A0AAU8CAV2_9EURY